MTRRVLVSLAVVGLVVGVVAIVSFGWPRPGPGGETGEVTVDVSPRVANRAASDDPVLPADLPAVILATTVMPIAAHETAGGRPFMDRDGHPILIESGLDLAIVGGPEQASGVPWFRVYVLPNLNMGPTDFFAWVPMTVDGAATLAVGAAATCPESRDVAALGPLDAITRLGCVGAEPFSLRGLTWERMLPVWYRVAPEWLGDQAAPTTPTISLHADALQRFPGPGEPNRFLDLQLPPELEHPPYEFEIEALVHAGDPASADCRRTLDAFSLVPPEAAQDTRLWCSTRLVVDQWTPLLGPEGRPIDGGRPQLHRHRAFPANAGCAGVGMPPLTFRIDESRLDPVWLEAAPNGPPIIPSFGPGFGVAFVPDLAVVDDRGRVVARNGTPVDPDGDLAGHGLCPTGLVVTFD